MALELEGTLRQKLGVQSGTGARGQWAKQEFVLEFPDGNFTAQACFTAWGQEKVAELEKYQAGDKVKVSFNLKSRDYNGRWYNDLQMWRIAPAGQAAPAAPAYTAAAAPSFPAQTGNPEPYAAPAPTLDDMPSDEGEDLPF